MMKIIVEMTVKLTVEAKTVTSDFSTADGKNVLLNTVSAIQRSEVVSSNLYHMLLLQIDFQ